MDSKASFKSRWIGDKAFYQKVMLILVPMIIQMGITNFVNLLDNIMVGQLGTYSISGVAVANQLIFVFNLMTFGILAGASIFGAQFYGKRDFEGYHQTVRFRLYVSVTIAILAWILFVFCGPTLIKLYLGSGDEVETIEYATRYLRVIGFQIIPFAIIQSYGGSLKDCGETKIPMQASVIAIFSNLVLNYILIYGKFGFPAMGIVGAALATVISRYLEILFLILSVRKNYDKLPFLHGMFRKWYVSKNVMKTMIPTSVPLFANEALWSMAITLINSSYAVRGINVVAATNINQTIWNLFGIVSMTTGNAVGILAGQHLGANDFEGAKDTVRKMGLLAVGVNLLVGAILMTAATYIPYVYQTEPEVRALASSLLRVCGFMMPVGAFANLCYFTLRSGGKTVITFFFDCVFMWVANLPLAWCLCHYTALPVLTIYIIVQSTEFIKSLIGIILLRSGIWLNNVLPDEA